jgi:hypothetical protein
MRCMRSGCIASLPCCFTPQERAADTHCLGNWVGPRACLDDMEKWTFLAIKSAVSSPIILQWFPMAEVPLPLYSQMAPVPQLLALTQPLLSQESSYTQNIFKALQKAVPSGLNSDQVKVTLWSTVSQSFLVSSSIWYSLPDISYCLYSGEAPSQMRGRVCHLSEP